MTIDDIRQAAEQGAYRGAKRAVEEVLAEYDAGRINKDERDRRITQMMAGSRRIQ